MNDDHLPMNSRREPFAVFGDGLRLFTVASEEGANPSQSDWIRVVPDGGVCCVQRGRAHVSLGCLWFDPSGSDLLAVWRHNRLFRSDWGQSNLIQVDPSGGVESLVQVNWECE